MSLLTLPLSRMEVKIVVILRATLAGTAEGEMKKQHHDKTTRTTAGTNMAETKLSVRRRNENTALRLAKEPKNVWRKESRLIHTRASLQFSKIGAFFRLVFSLLASIIWHSEESQT